VRFGFSADELKAMDLAELGYWLAAVDEYWDVGRGGGKAGREFGMTETGEAKR
jgi:hypothetical protein